MPFIMELKLISFENKMDLIETFGLNLLHKIQCTARFILQNCVQATTHVTEAIRPTLLLK